MCNANNEVILFSMNCPGSESDRTAFPSFHDIVLNELPDGFYIIGDAAHLAFDTLPTPHLTTTMTDRQDATNLLPPQRGRTIA